MINEERWMFVDEDGNEMTYAGKIIRFRVKGAALNFRKEIRAYSNQTIEVKKIED